MTKKNIYKILILLSFLIIFLLFFIFDLKSKCIFKKLFNIACPGCGLTRSIRAILSFDLIASIKYNILGIPLVLFITFSSIILLKEIIKGEDKLIPYVKKILSKYYWLVILILVITMIINNITGV